MRIAGRLVPSLVVLLALLLVTVVGAQETLTNDSVIAMKKAGLSDAVILAKIRSSQSKFDVNTESLVNLKKAGLSDQIIEAMVGHAGPAGAPPGTATAPARAAASTGMPQGRDSIYHMQGDKYVELNAAGAALETNFAFFQSKSEIVLKGKKAAYRIADRQPVFLSAWAPNEAPLVRLKPGDDHDDRNL